MDNVHDRCEVAKGMKCFKCVMCGKDGTNYWNGIDLCDECVREMSVCCICGENMSENKVNAVDNS